MNLSKHVYVLLCHAREDSCGFEHVFVGETKHGQEIMGLHNWVQFYLQEKHNHVDYKGYKARDNKDSVRNQDVDEMNTELSCVNTNSVSKEFVFLLI